MPILDVPVERIDGTPTSLAEHKGKVMLIVNVASQCGFTPQYAALETLYETNHEKGFVVCGFPANDFAAQEPGSNEEIQSFCETSFGVKFPMYSKIAVTGADKKNKIVSLLFNVGLNIFTNTSSSLLTPISLHLCCNIKLF